MKQKYPFRTSGTDLTSVRKSSFDCRTKLSSQRSMRRVKIRYYEIGIIRYRLRSDLLGHDTTDAFASKSLSSDQPTTPLDRDKYVKSLNASTLKDIATRTQTLFRLTVTGQLLLVRIYTHLLFLEPAVGEHYTCPDPLDREMGYFFRLTMDMRSGPSLDVQ